MSSHCEACVSEDWFESAVARVAQAGRAACVSLEDAVRSLEDGARWRSTGRSVTDIVDDLLAGGGRDIRLGTTDVFRDYERAIAAMRASVVRFLVDDEGLSLTDVARKMGVSRQAVARLYRSDVEDGTLDPRGE
jgi:hypothetical protein